MIGWLVILLILVLITVIKVKQDANNNINSYSQIDDKTLLCSSSITTKRGHINTTVLAEELFYLQI